MTRKELGEKIREIRMAKNLTRDQLATRSELSSKFLYEIEKGRKGLSVESLMKITLIWLPADPLSSSLPFGFP